MAICPQGNHTVGILPREWRWCTLCEWMNHTTDRGNDNICKALRDAVFGIKLFINPYLLLFMSTMLFLCRVFGSTPSNLCLVVLAVFRIKLFINLYLLLLISTTLFLCRVFGSTSSNHCLVVLWFCTVFWVFECSSELKKKMKDFNLIGRNEFSKEEIWSWNSLLWQWNELKEDDTGSKRMRVMSPLLKLWQFGVWS